MTDGGYSKTEGWNLQLQAEITKLRADVERLREAIGVYQSDFRTEGCPDPKCGVCRRSKAAKAGLENILAATEPKP